MDTQLHTKLNHLNLNESFTDKSTQSNKKEIDNELLLEENKSLKFDPPLYLQRYDYVCELIRKYECKTFMDIGVAECKMLRYIKNTTNKLNLIIGLDLDGEKLDFEKEKFTISWFDHIQAKEEPLEVYLLAGDITQPDEYFTKLLKMINLDFISLVELIEHLQPEMVSKCIHTVFNLIQPKYVLMTTPNKEFNVLFDMDDDKFRHWDHKFEWTRNEFQQFCQTEILKKYPQYELVYFDGLGQPPNELLISLGHCTQMALFKLKSIPLCETHFNEYIHSLKRANYINRKSNESSRVHLEPLIDVAKLKDYKLVSFTRYPFEMFEFENKDQRDEALFNEIDYLISFLSRPSQLSPNSSNDSDELSDEQKEKLDNAIDLYDEKIRIASVNKLISFNSIQKFKLSKFELIELMEREGYEFTRSGKYVYERIHFNDDSFYSNYSSYDYDPKSSSYDNNNTSFRIDDEDWDKECNEQLSKPINAFNSEEDWDIEMLNTSSIGATNPTNNNTNAAVSNSNLINEITYSDNKICGPFEQFEDADHEIDINNNHISETKFHGKIYACTTTTCHTDNLNVSSRFEITYNDSERKKLALTFRSLRRRYYKEFKKKEFSLNIVPSQFEEPVV